jgi:hypothetical protein
MDYNDLDAKEKRKIQNINYYKRGSRMLTSRQKEVP